jgi:hypothetical protein
VHDSATSSAAAGLSRRLRRLHVVLGGVRVAPTVDVLIAFRALQGAFGALMIPPGFGLMKQVFDDDAEFDKATGLFGPATAAWVWSAWGW